MSRSEASAIILGTDGFWNLHKVQGQHYRILRSTSAPCVNRRQMTGMGSRVIS